MWLTIFELLSIFLVMYFTPIIIIRFIREQEITRLYFLLNAIGWTGIIYLFWMT